MIASNKKSDGWEETEARLVRTLAVARKFCDIRAMLKSMGMPSPKEANMEVGMCHITWYQDGYQDGRTRTLRVNAHLDMTAISVYTSSGKQGMSCVVSPDDLSGLTVALKNAMKFMNEKEEE